MKKILVFVLVSVLLAACSTVFPATPVPTAPTPFVVKSSQGYNAWLGDPSIYEDTLFVEVPRHDPMVYEYRTITPAYSNPIWSPDGWKVAFVGKGDEIFVFDIRWDNNTRSTPAGIKEKIENCKLDNYGEISCKGG